ncbi:MAG TPA: BadF/BadG/BcrA/BcrD ATPase family protein [Microlunatus sp.]
MAARPGNPYVIAVDAGGSHTRVGCFAMDGSTLSRTRGGGGSPDHNDDAERNVSSTLLRCLQEADLEPADAVGMAAGMAAIHRVGSNQGSVVNDWAARYLSLPSLTCPRTIVNDAVTAHRGALLGQPGVIVVAGTGSMILAISEDGRQVESGQLQHYAGGARHLVQGMLQLILTDDSMPADASFLAEVLSYWQADDTAQLRERILALETTDRNDAKRRYGDLAPRVTACADTSPLADRALRNLTGKTARGIALLAPLVGSKPVLASCIGALATDPRFVARLADDLAGYSGSPARLVPAALDPLSGAALLAYEVAGVRTDPDVTDRLALNGSAEVGPPPS